MKELKSLDIVYVFRKGPVNSIALRYSLRSLVNVPHRNVYLVGDNVRWASVNHISEHDNSTRSYRGRLLNVWRKLIKACENPGVSDDFILFNDDFFVLQPHNQIPYYHKGLIKKYKDPTGYEKAIERTARHFSKPLHFGVHLPMILNKKKLLALTDIYNINLGFDHRVLYGNHYKVSPTVQIRDVKAYTPNADPLDLAYSTNNKIEASAKFLTRMNKLFPNRSKYETDIL